MIETSPNIERNVWRRLRKNKGAMFGIVIIVISILVAIFCYFIAVDSTPNANRMSVEIAAKKPGYKQQFLKIISQNKNRDGFFKRLISGRTDASVFIPITGYRIKGDSLEIDKFIGQGISEKQVYFFPDKKDYEIVSVRYLLGTDKYGRDILSRLLVGVRVSLAVGLITVLISLSIGVVLGALAGYFRGWVDDVIMWLINVIWSIPTLLLVFATTLVLGKGFWQVFVAIGLTMWVGVARIIRGQVLSVREMDYVEAAKALGYRNSRIIFKHILPNVMGPVLVISASGFATAIVIEAGLSFLGVGVQPPQPSWGLMIKENYNFIITHNPALALAPGIAIMLLVLAFNLLGNGLRDALEVRS